MSDAATRLFDIFRDPRFLSMTGLVNEVPIYIHAYDSVKEDEMRRTVDHVASRLQMDGISVAQIDLLDIILDQLAEEQRLNRILDREVALGKPKLLDLLSNLTDPETRLIPRLKRYIDNEDFRLTLITGAGRVFPFLRTHTILEHIQPAMTRHPIVLFFPGEYVNGIDGSVLKLFGSQTNLYRPYYRAINLDDYHL